MKEFWILNFGFPIGPSHKKFLCSAVTGLLFAFGISAEAQQPKKVPRIACLYAGSPSLQAARVDAFRQGLRELGYVEGKTVLIEYRFAEGNIDRLPALAAEIVRLKVDLIVTSGGAPTRAVKEATNTIPIVMAQDPDPIGNGFVSSLARPGGNITGLSNFATELSGKRLELLKDVVLKLSRVAVFGNAAAPGNAQMVKETELAAGSFGVKLHYIEMRISKDIDTAFHAANKSRSDAILLLVRGPVALSYQEIAGLAVKSRLPMIYSGREFVEAGGLMSYGVNSDDLDRRAAVYVDKILKGAKPAEIPVEQPKKFEFIINLKAAKQIGLTIPPNVLARADKVIR